MTDKIIEMTSNVTKKINTNVNRDKELEMLKRENDLLRKEVVDKQNYIDFLISNDESSWQKVPPRNQKSSKPNHSNKFLPLQNNEDVLPNRNKQQWEVNNSTNKTVVPGNTSYAKMTKSGKNISVIGDSIIAGIRRKEMNKHANGNISLKYFKGSTTEDLNKYHIMPTLNKKLTDIMVLHVGANDIMPRNGVVKLPCNVADSVVDLGKKCNENGVNTVLISSVIKQRKGIRTQARINEINDLLKTKCSEMGFIFVDNSNVNMKHLSDDGLHLNYSGTCQLANNILRKVNMLCQHV